MWNPKKYKKPVKIIKKKQAHRHREQTSDHHWEEGSRKEKSKDRGMRYELLGVK